ncbi:hypothetical protein NQ317_017957 [Molorchus minor]|uniref:DUF4797 domain-containing protein n=1 Tax=Molorchus minor TaxID=1323400 RepID=A0ABQ9JPE0_9CUCU|nr:hypothetical protein NQ317_017957 [Molorchus minor]
MATNENSVVLMSIVPDSRSTSPMTPSPLREIRGIRLFRVISRKLARRSNDDLNYTVDAECRSSSSDSCSSSSISRSSRSKKEVVSGNSMFTPLSPNHMSSSSSESGSDIHSKVKHHHSTSAESIRKVFQNLNLNARSQSCSKDKRKTKKPAPKRILRQPVTYTYVKGLSGLPTQRIPRNPKIFKMPCGCSMEYIPGLNR